jgi:oligopeptide transport system ATP-binding protein
MSEPIASDLNTTETVSDNEKPVLKVDDLRVYFPFSRGVVRREHGVIRAVDGVSFVLREGETLGIVGESGCGKSTMARAILNLIPATSGQVWFQGDRLDRLPESRMRAYRRRLQMIFQDPFSSLNPRMTVGAIIGEPMKVFQRHAGRSRKLEVMRLMDLVGLNPRFLNRYPHEFSGGQRQRIGIARALAVQPKVVICDEPVSALDVSIQAQVINLLMDLKDKLGLAYIFISHDLSVVRHISDRVGVMYLGRLVETTESARLYDDPRHPYTKALLSAIPLPNPDAEARRRRTVLSGEVPSPETEFAGCRFASRCPIADADCRATDPTLDGDVHQVACLKAEAG